MENLIIFKSFVIQTNVSDPMSNDYVPVGHQVPIDHVGDQGPGFKA